MAWKYKGQSYSWGPPAEGLMKNGVVMCPKCGKHEANLDGTLGVMDCDWCKAKSQGITVPKGVKSVPEYIRQQQEKHHDDFVQPHITENGKLKINPEFIKLYPDKAHLYYSEDEMKRAGYPKLVDFSRKVKENEARQREQVERFKEKVVKLRQQGVTNREEFIKRLRES